MAHRARSIAERRGGLENDVDLKDRLRNSLMLLYWAECRSLETTEALLQVEQLVQCDRSLVQECHDTTQEHLHRIRDIFDYLGVVLDQHALAQTQPDGAVAGSLFLVRKTPSVRDTCAASLLLERAACGHYQSCLSVAREYANAKVILILQESRREKMTQRQQLAFAFQSQQRGSTLQMVPPASSAAPVDDLQRHSTSA